MVKSKRIRCEAMVVTEGIIALRFDKGQAFSAALSRRAFNFSAQTWTFGWLIIVR